VSNRRDWFSLSVDMKAISGGPMAGRHNYQTCHIQEVRADEVFQISWLEGESTFAGDRNRH
jgi:hypothetical protein